MKVDPTPSTRVKRAVMGLSALAMLGSFVMMVLISSTRPEEPKGIIPRSPPAASRVPSASAEQALPPRPSQRDPQPTRTGVRLVEDAGSMRRASPAADDAIAGSR